MVINILYFASVKDRLGTARESLDVPASTTGTGLMKILKSRGEPWVSVFSDTKLLIAINQEMANETDLVNEGDEVAFFPPVTGG